MTTPIAEHLTVTLTQRRTGPMATVVVAWQAENRTLPPTTPPLDSWKVAAGLPGQPAAAAVTIADLAVRTASLDVPDGDGYVATVTLASADGTVIGPSAASTPFTIKTLPVPTVVNVTVP